MDENKSSRSSVKKILVVEQDGQDNTNKRFDHNEGQFIMALNLLQNLFLFQSFLFHFRCGKEKSRKLSKREAKSKVFAS